MVSVAVLPAKVPVKATDRVRELLGFNRTLESEPDAMENSFALAPDSCIDFMITPTLPPDVAMAMLLLVPFCTCAELGAVRVLAILAAPIGLSVPKYSIFFWFPPPRLLSLIHISEPTRR